ncbi:hypothetical protein [Enterobacter asburiae]|uniref:hypothetical protein n=1 Tax=Enterobacter asburiae TaxID=61645 RepID=UPI001652A834|nr:hypothetical protein [Enterobacter asburiae]
MEWIAVKHIIDKALYFIQSPFFNYKIIFLINHIPDLSGEINVKAKKSEVSSINSWRRMD